VASGPGKQTPLKRQRYTDSKQFLQCILEGINRGQVMVEVMVGASLKVPEPRTIHDEHVSTYRCPPGVATDYDAVLHCRGNG
jgi:hypothetical protein